MANIGTQISTLLRSQGFDYADFNAANLTSKQTGLQFMARFEKMAFGYRNVYVNIDRNEDNTYNISFGLGTKTPKAESVAEAELAQVLNTILRKEKYNA